jgi:hypothetical protein
VRHPSYNLSIREPPLRISYEHFIGLSIRITCVRTLVNSQFYIRLVCARHHFGRGQASCARLRGRLSQIRNLGRRRETFCYLTVYRRVCSLLCA